MKSHTLVSSGATCRGCIVQPRVRSSAQCENYREEIIRKRRSLWRCSVTWPVTDVACIEPVGWWCLDRLVRPARGRNRNGYENIYFI